jgi:hypothetical protein
VTDDWVREIKTKRRLATARASPANRPAFAIQLSGLLPTVTRLAVEPLHPCGLRFPVLPSCNNRLMGMYRTVRFVTMAKSPFGGERLAMSSGSPGPVDGWHRVAIEIVVGVTVIVAQWVTLGTWWLRV